MKPLSSIVAICVGLAYLLISALYPFEVVSDFTGSIGHFFASFLRSFPTSIDQLAGPYLIEKFLLYIPLGVLLYYAFKAPKRTKATTIFVACSCASLITWLVEISQSLFVGRHGNALDLLGKTGGSICGTWFAGCCPTRVTERLGLAWRQIERSKVPWLFALLWAVLPGLTFAMQYPWFSFRTWESHFSFQLGNEGSGTNPWLGKIYLAALYDRVLSAEEIARHFQSATASGALVSCDEQGLVALYTFSEATGNTAHDSAGYGAPLDLIFLPPSHVRWLAESNGIEILQPASIKSYSPATKLLTALTDDSALSIEVWIQPANITQTKFAHILSFAYGWRAWNFVLAQTYADVLFYVRTPLTGYDREVKHLHTDDGFLTTERLHLVATYQDGVERLYVNGTERIYANELATEGLVGFPLGFPVQRNRIAKIAYSFFYFFPLACLSAGVLSPQCQGAIATLLLSMAMGTSLVSVTEIAQAIAFDRAIDLPLLGYGALMGMIGALSGIVFTNHSRSSHGHSRSHDAVSGFHAATEI